MHAVCLDGAVGDDRRRHVEHDRRLAAGWDRDRERIGAEQRLGAAPWRHVVGAGDHRIDADHAVRERQGRIDSGGAGVVRAPRPDPGDAGRARQLDRGLGGARHHQVAHAVVAVDQRGRRRRFGHPDVGRAIDAAGAQAAHVLRQSEHAVRVGAGEVGLGHQLGDLAGVGRGQADGGERVLDQAGDRRRRHPLRRPCLVDCGHRAPRSVFRPRDTTPVATSENQRSADCGSPGHASFLKTIGCHLPNDAGGLNMNVRANHDGLPPYGNSTLAPGIRSRAVSNVNGMTVHMLEAGFETSGRPAVLLLHGFPELAYSWRKVMLPLAAAGYHVIAPDQRGYGRTTGWDGSYDADPDPFRILNMVRDAVGLVYALGHRSVAGVVGHDAGSPVAAWSALIRPDIFRSVVLMSSPFAGAPSLPFDTANGAAPPRPAATDDELDAELAKLPRPRKYYQNYQRGRGANDDMLHAPQGLHAFFRAYYHYKSADWTGEQAVPAQGAHRRGAGEDPDLLRDGSRQGHGRDGRGRDAVGGRDRGLQVADRRRGRRLRRRVCQDRLHRRPAGLSGAARHRPQEHRRDAHVLGPHHRRAVLLHRRQERLGRLPDARAPRSACGPAPARRWWASIWWTEPGTGRSRSSPSR